MSEILAVMRKSRAKSLSTALAAGGLVACAPSVSTSDAKVISKEVRPLLDAMCDGKSPVSPDRWPPSLRALEPDTVQVTPEGLYARTSKFMASDYGVFVACHPDQFNPKGRVEPSFRSIGDGVYIYYVAG